MQHWPPGLTTHSTLREFIPALRNNRVDASDGIGKDTSELLPGATAALEI